MEKQNSESLEFNFGGDHYSIVQDCTVSCHNVYFSTEYRRNGKKGDVRILRALLRDLVAEEETAVA